MVCSNVDIVQGVAGIVKGEDVVKWFRVLMWIGSMCYLAALVFGHFLPHIVALSFIFAGTAIITAALYFLTDGE